MKNNKILISIVVLILVVLLGIFVIYPKFIKNNSNNKIKEISLNDDRVASLIKKIEFNNVILADIYKNGDFDRNTIPNDLILKMGLPSWNIDIGIFEKYPSDPYNYMYWILQEELIEKNIKNLFGDIKYVHGDLNNNIVCTNRGDSNIGYSDFGFCLSALYSEDQQYKIVTRENGLGNPNIYIKQIPYKAENVDNKKINLYVKTYYTTMFYCDNYEFDIGIEKVYKSYNYINNKFDDDYILIEGVRHADEYAGGNELRNCIYKMIENTEIKAYDEYISEIEPEKLKNYDFFDKLDSYVYTFELSDDGNYYLSSFKKVAK